jgi:hypothetical protein
MLLPKPCSITFLTGDAISVTSSRVINQMIRTPFHDFRDLHAPEINALKILMSAVFIMK